MNNLTLTLARALAPRIRVNAIAPGFIDAEWLREEKARARRREGQGGHPRTHAAGSRSDSADADGMISILTGPGMTTGHVIPHEACMISGPGFTD